MLALQDILDRHLRRVVHDVVHHEKRRGAAIATAAVEMQPGAGSQTESKPHELVDFRVARPHVIGCGQAQVLQAQLDRHVPLGGEPRGAHEDGLGRVDAIFRCPSFGSS